VAKKDLTPERFGGLDAVRRTAALSLVLFHAIGIYARGSAPDAWTHDWVARLDVGVPIFFLLSGFLLYRPFVRARAAGAEPSLRAYAWRRFLRIFPGYWVALIVAVLALGLSGALAPRYLLLLQAYSKDTVAGGLPQAWTLCVEVAFYAFLPLWAAFVRRTAAPELPALAALFPATPRRGGSQPLCSSSSRRRARAWHTRAPRASRTARSWCATTCTRRSRSACWPRP